MFPSCALGVIRDLRLVICGLPRKSSISNHQSQTMTTDNKVCLITGSSSGFGLLTAVDMARAGFRVIATMRDTNKATSLMKAGKDAGVSENMEMRPLDIRKFAALPGIGNEIAATHGRLDVQVNNAAYIRAG